MSWLWDPIYKYKKDSIINMPVIPHECFKYRHLHNNLHSSFINLYFLYALCKLNYQHYPFYLLLYFNPNQVVLVSKAGNIVLSLLFLPTLLQLCLHLNNRDFFLHFCKWKLVKKRTMFMQHWKFKDFHFYFTCKIINTLIAELL